MHPRVRAQLLALAVGGGVFLLACACSSTFLNLATLLLGLQSPTLSPSVRALVTSAVGGGGLLAGVVAAGIAGGLLYRRLARA